MGGQLLAAGDFLIRTLFDLYIMAVLLRFLLQLVRADFYNPISQFLVTVTNPVLVPLRRFIPGFAGIDMAAVVLLLGLEALKFVILYLLLYQVAPNVMGLLIVSLAELLQSLVNIYFFAIILLVIASWVMPGNYNPLLAILYSLTEPLMHPARRIMPPISGFDLSPLIVLIGLHLLSMLLIDPLLQFGSMLSVGVVR